MSEVKLYDLSQPFGHNAPLWPYFPDVKIERFHYHAKSGVLSQQITTFMHCTTHADSPAHVIEGAPYTDEIPLESYYGTGVVVDIPKEKWGVITPDDLEKARPKIEKGDIVIVHTGWHHYYGDSRKYFAYSPGLYREAGEWFVEAGVQKIGIHFFSPEDFGLDMQMFEGPGISRAYCANVIIDLMKIPFNVFFHAIRETDGGVEYRSRYWLGYTMKNGAPVRVKRPVPYKMKDLARNNCLHSLTEYNNLASFLPQLYEEMGGKI